MTYRRNDHPTHGNGAGPKPAGIGPCLLWIAASGVAASAAGALLGAAFPGASGGGRVLQAAFVIAAAAAGTFLWRFWGRIYRTITSVPFGVALLLALGTAVAAGTFIPQAAVPEEYVRRYGASVAGAFRFLRLDDVFRSSWFNAWLALLGVSLVLVTIRQKAWHRAMWGPGLCHLGITVILIGGLLGNLGGYKGAIELREGETADGVLPLPGREGKDRPRPLGFTVALEDFDAQRYPDEFRFALYEKDGPKGWRLARVIAVDAAKEWREAGGSRFRAVRVFPDFVQRVELREKPAGAGVPAAEIEALSEAGSRRLLLLDGVEGRDAVVPWPRAPKYRFAWEPPDEAALRDLAATSPESHRIAVRKDACCDPVEIEVKPGGEHVLPDGAGTLRVLAYYPDFTYDGRERKASTRSPEPNNPALQVAMVQPVRPGSPQASGGEGVPRWLFARNPDYGREHQGGAAAGPDLVYRHVPGRKPADLELLIVGRTRELWRFKSGVLAQKSPLPPDAPHRGGGDGEAGDESFLAVHRILASAEEVRIAESRSDAWRNPAVEVEVAGPGGTRTRLMQARHGDPEYFADGKTVLAFEARPPEMKSFRSRLAVLVDGKKVAAQEISVNDPLAWGGWHFYQSSWRKEDPTWSGILVVKDPGLPVVWIGFIVSALGVLVTYVLPGGRRDPAPGPGTRG